MNKLILSSLALLAASAGALAQTKPVPAPAKAPEDVPSTEVVHFWISGSEAAALGVVRQAFEARGGVWKDRPAKNNDATRKMVLDRIVGGYPPGAMQWHAGSDLKDIVDMGAVADIDSVALHEQWRAHMPALVADRASYTGKFYLAPVGIHAENWLWTNSRVLADQSLKVPATWDEFFAIAPKLKQRGVTPLAIGGGAWEHEILFNNILLSYVGKASFRRLMEKGDTSVLRSPAAAQAFATLARMRQYADPDLTGRSWSDATADVIAGRSAMQVMGDWAKGEFLRAGMTPGKEFQCTLAPGNGDAYHVVVDAFAFPTTSDPRRREWQQKLAETLLDPAVQLEFSRIKGSIPVRTDVDRSKLDACAQLGMKVVAVADNQISPPSMQLQFNLRAGMMSLASAYFLKPEGTPEQAAEQLARVFERMAAPPAAKVAAK